MTELTLADPPRVRVFKASEYDELRKTVDVVNVNTTMSPLDVVRQLELDSRGKLEDGYRFTTTALRQVCRLLALGLSNLVGDMSGRLQRADSVDVDQQPEATIAIFNKVARLRFHRVLGKQLVRNTEARTIDGLVGPKYRYLANVDFLQQIDTGVTTRPVKFHRAYLYGRQLAVRYIHADEKLRIDPHVFAPGQHYANSEVGSASVRAAPMLTTPQGYAALGRWVRRLPHAGRDFSKNLTKLFSAMPESVPGLDIFEARLQSLREQPLIIDTALSRVSFARERDRLERRLIGWRLTRQLARRVTALAFFGENLTTFEGFEDFTSSALAIQSRTAYDVFTALIEVPTRMSIPTRESVEQIAYDLLLGRLRIKPKE